jgi:hypothetical protein
VKYQLEIDVEGLFKEIKDIVYLHLDLYYFQRFIYSEVFKKITNLNEENKKASYLSDTGKDETKI